MNKVEIKYCSLCGWLIRSSWMAQELLTTFSQELDEVSLQPASSGLFEIVVNGKRVWSREHDGGFPDIKTLKQRVRDIVIPSKDLGHIDR
ncbi:Rdx family protein [Thalassotalea agarivorans]|uniref:Selenoprotein W-related protein n=1 Tax=Thalassotalea agarivorans TaxID=349064 RepID=A0A1I0HHN1_THASX|nr:SelT/SelW/SelH family protein [Thalassotalea agarivorans]SET83434.1 selenoprotein W-related protein [Thalassotalea agarivorans]